MENKRFTIDFHKLHVTTGGIVKKYTILDSGKNIIDYADIKEISALNICNLLNELHEENQRLKEQLERLAKP